MDVNNNTNNDDQRGSNDVSGDAAVDDGEVTGGGDNADTVAGTGHDAGTIVDNDNDGATANTNNMNTVLEVDAPFNDFDEFVSFLNDAIKMPVSSSSSFNVMQGHPQQSGRAGGTNNDTGDEMEESTTDATTRGEIIPLEILQSIASFFTICPVDMSIVRAVDASSNAFPNFDLNECLVDNDKTWWISKPALPSREYPRGLVDNPQWVEFTLGTVKRRISHVEIKIPPLPQGPLSVHRFRLEKSETMVRKNDKGDMDYVTYWSDATNIQSVENMEGWQRIDDFEPFDADRIRIVCLSNQYCEYYPGRVHDPLTIFHTVGFFSVRFG